MTAKARVHKGRLLLDEPTQLHEGTEVDLLPLNPGDWLDSADRGALHRALVASRDDVAAGRLIDVEEVLKRTARIVNTPQVQRSLDLHEVAPGKLKPLRCASLGWS